MYEWDDAKSEANRTKRGFDFAIIHGFDWSTAVIIPDDRFEYGEERARAFGRIDGRGYCVAFTLRAPNIRIISIRPMNDKETRRYGI